MMLIAGGTGLLGTQVVRLLTAQGLSLRVLTRDPRKAQQLSGEKVEIICGAVQDRSAIEQAVAGANVVISAIQGFSGAGDSNPRTVDLRGNSALIQAAQQAGVERFILVSVHGAAPDHPIELFRMKYAAEQALRASRLSWTIIRPTAYMETWCEVLGRPLLDKGKTQVFGNGRNPINWVSAADVAEFVALAALDPEMRGAVIEVGGPDNLSMSAFVDAFRKEVGSSGNVGHVPRAAMRLMAVAMNLVNPEMGRQIQMGVIMDTRPQAFDASATRRRYPSIPITSLDEVVRRDFAASRAQGA